MVFRKVENYFRYLEKTFGGLKFAIILILIFTLSLAVGTITESYHGTEYANRLIYKSPFFMGLQFFIFLSIFFATTLRLPPQKRLYGFYTLHAGLLLIFIGSFVTFNAGVDGTLTLFPNTPSRFVNLSQDVISIKYPDRQEQVTYQLPFKSGPININTRWKNIELETFYPFSDNQLEWVALPSSELRLPSSAKSFHSSEYFLFNENVSQAVVTSLHPSSTDFPASLSLGPLSIHYLPEELMPCFEKNHASKLIIWNSDNKTCFTPEDEGIPLQKTKNNHRFLAFKGKEDSRIFTFFPDFSPWPVTENFQMMENSPLKIFSQHLFEGKPNLFLFGLGASYFQDGKWITFPMDLKQNNLIELPWMDFRLRLINHFTDKRPQWVPYYTKPIHDNGEIIKGNKKSLKILIQGESYWVQDDRPLSLLVNGEKVTFELKKQTLPLPYEISLDRFKMDTDPGTNNPASFESFVTLFHSEGYDKHHIFMNNPLQYNHFTFYQASYFPSENDGGYGSILSANYDPGRPIKYLGSILLVLGSMIHYYLNRERYRSKKI